MRDIAYFDSYAVRATFQDAHAKWGEIPASQKGETIELFGLGARGQTSLLHWESRWCCDDAGNWVSEKPPAPSSFDVGLLVFTKDLDNPKIVEASVLDPMFHRYSDLTEIPLEKFKKARAEGIPFTFVSAYEGKDSAGADIKETITHEFIPRKKK